MKSFLFLMALAFLGTGVRSHAQTDGRPPAIPQEIQQSAASLADVVIPASSLPAKSEAVVAPSSTAVQQQGQTGGGAIEASSEAQASAPASTSSNPLPSSLPPETSNTGVRTSLPSSSPVRTSASSVMTSSSKTTELSSTSRIQTSASASSLLASSISSSPTSSSSSSSFHSFLSSQAGSGSLLFLTKRETFFYTKPIIDPEAIAGPARFSLEPQALAGTLSVSLLFTLLLGFTGWLLKYLQRVHGDVVKKVFKLLPLQAALTALLIALYRLLVPLAEAQGFAQNTASFVQIPAVAALFFVIVGVTNTAFNNILMEKTDRIHALLFLDAKKLRSVWLILLLILLYGFVGGFVNPDFSLLPAQELGMAIVIVAAVILSAYLKDVVSYGLAKRWQYESWFQGHLVGLLVAVLCVFLTRHFGLNPGFIYGVPAGLVIAAHLTRDRAGKLETIGIVSKLFICLGFWFAASSLTNYPVLLDLTNVIFVILVEDTFLDMIPISTLSGESIFQWRKVVWGLLFTVITFLLFHTLLNPEGTIPNLEKHPPAMAALWFLACWTAGILLLWLLVIWRSRKEAYKPGLCLHPAFGSLCGLRKRFPAIKPVRHYIMGR